MFGKKNRNQQQADDFEGAEAEFTEDFAQDSGDSTMWEDAAPEGEEDVIEPELRDRRPSPLAKILPFAALGVLAAGGAGFFYVNYMQPATPAPVITAAPAGEAPVAAAPAEEVVAAAPTDITPVAPAQAPTEAMGETAAPIITAPEQAPAPKPAPKQEPAPAVSWWKAASQRAALNPPAPRFYASPRAERRDRWEQAAAKRLQGLRNWQALEREQQERRFREAAKLERGDAVKAFNTQQRHDLTNLLYKEQAEALAAELQRQQERRERWDKPTQRREPRPRTYPPPGFKAWLSALFTAKAAKPAPTPQPARPLADAEPPKAPEKSLWERIQQRQTQQAESQHQSQGRGRSPMGDLLSSHFNRKSKR